MLIFYSVIYNLREPPTQIELGLPRKQFFIISHICKINIKHWQLLLYRFWRYLIQWIVMSNKVFSILYMAPLMVYLWF